uniref:Defensin beta 128 n=1 Tax=Sciurus vulgaris TaxID=55149 RepID=A0A8D2ALB4_SCIVU
MKLFLVLIILLCESLKDAIQPKKCFNNVTGFCRKRCKLGETSDVGCLRGKHCCVNVEENKKYQQAHEPVKPPVKQPRRLKDYVVMPTITVATFD